MVPDDWDMLLLLQYIQLHENTTTFFYARLVGPSIVPGFTERLNRTVYILKYKVPLPGIYSMQIAVDYGAVPSIGDQPDLHYLMDNDVYFEGKDIPGSPFKVLVQAFGSQGRASEDLPTCTGPSIGIGGHWALKTNTSCATPVPFVQATYIWQPTNCKLPDWDCLHSTAALGRCYNTKRLKIFFIGDSLMRIQWHQFKSAYGFKPPFLDGTEFYDISDGLALRLSDASRAIDAAVAYQNSIGNASIWFNSGLHDMAKYCASSFRTWRVSKGLEEKYNCTQLYIKTMKAFIEIVEKSNFHGSKIFRLTPASAMRYGNTQIRWANFLRSEQSFITSRYVVQHFNEHVVSLFEQAGWLLVDAYENTLSRPERAEVTGGAGAFIHFADDIVDLHNKQALALQTWNDCPDIYKIFC
eukprot:TRINITY_DN4972_c0_g1_i3.p1 TRINITY_DN4972_c0_g1~~TRINITY_DN4972_c0_g1_i3.p1  ORF type:complete len:411 (-),score=-4.49 TRINITY_DN4972_c0_g1_i3:280-1512(-)